MGTQELPSFEELHPYGLTSDQLSIALWALFTILGIAIFAYLYSVFSRVRENGYSTRTLMGMNVRTQKQDRAETLAIIEKQRKNAQK